MDQEFEQHMMKSVTVNGIVTEWLTPPDASFPVTVTEYCPGGVEVLVVTVRVDVAEPPASSDRLVGFNVAVIPFDCPVGVSVTED